MKTTRWKEVADRLLEKLRMLPDYAVGLVLDEMASLHIDFSLEHDVGYGIDKRTGWSMCVDGVSNSTFAPSQREAIEDALKNCLTWED